MKKARRQNKDESRQRLEEQENPEVLVLARIIASGLSNARRPVSAVPHDVDSLPTGE